MPLYLLNTENLKNHPNKVNKPNQASCVVKQNHPNHSAKYIWKQAKRTNQIATGTHIKLSRDGLLVLLNTQERTSKPRKVNVSPNGCIYAKRHIMYFVTSHMYLFT